MIAQHFDIDRDLANWLRSRSIWIDTPCHDGRCHWSYHRAMLALSDLLNQWGIRHLHHTKVGESLITRARNKNAACFLQSGMTHMLCVDSDIHFNAPDVPYMLALSRSYPGIIGGPYAKKQVNWERIAMAANHDTEYPLDLMPRLGADPVLNFTSGSHHIDQPDSDVRHLGTGFMLIPRYVFEQLEKSSVLDTYKLSSGEQEEVGQDRITAFFEAKVVDDGYPSEDWYLCDKWRSIGGKVWLCPWMRTIHTGSYDYHCDLSAIQQTGLEIGGR